MKLFRTIILSCLVFVAIALLSPQNSHAEWGATIEATNCNPKADPAVDANKLKPEWKSCISRKIRMNDFKVKVKMEPTYNFRWKFILDNLVSILSAATYAAAYNVAYGITFQTTYNLFKSRCPPANPARAECKKLAHAPSHWAGQKAGVEAVIKVMLAEFVIMLASDQVTNDSYSYNTLVSNDDIDASYNTSHNVMKWISLGANSGLVPTLVIGPTGKFLPMVSAEVRIEGDRACVYVKEGFMYLSGFKAERSEEFNKNYFKDGIAPDGLPSHCVYLPPPVATPKPPFPAFISQSCVDYNSEGSQFRWPHTALEGERGNSRSVIGVVVQCVEETMMNLFFSSNGGDSIFVKMQDQLASYVQALLVLYVIILGFKYGLIERAGVKQAEFVWIGLRIALVLYFATGTAMTQLLPGLIGGMKDISAIIIDAAAGPSGTNVAGGKDKARAALATADQNYNIARHAYAVARKNWALATDPTQKASLQSVMDQAQDNESEKAKILENARISTLSFGYNYCDFRPFVDQGKYNIEVLMTQDTTLFSDTKVRNATTTLDDITYPAGSIIPAGKVIPGERAATANSSATDGTWVVRDMSYMHLWDSIDCRLAKYLGIGANPQSPHVPQFLVLGIASIFMGPVGVIIFLLTMTFLIFIVLIIIRIVHIYLIAFVAIIMLTYISPLVFPMVFFAQMRDSFANWLTQLIGYIMQPIILFAFMAFMFAVFDNIIWGSNYDFYPEKKEEMVKRNLVEWSSERLYDNSIKMVHPDGSTCDPKMVHSASLVNNGTPDVCKGAGADCVPHPENYDCHCPDEDTIGCMYQKFKVDTIPVKILGGKLLDIYHVYSRMRFDVAGATSDIVHGQNVGTALDEAVASSSTNRQNALSAADFTTYMINLLKVVFTCFIIHAMLGQVETISATLTNIAKSAASMSSAPAPSPHAVGAGVMKATAGAGKLGAKVARGAGGILGGAWETGKTLTGINAYKSDKARDKIDKMQKDNDK